MACMEHHCTNPTCNWSEMDNESHKACPKCSAKVRSYFDEQADHDREAYEAKHGPIENEEESDERNN